MNIFKPSTWGGKKVVEEVVNKTPETPPSKKGVTGITPGRVSAPDNDSTALWSIKSFTSNMVTPSFRTELIPLIRDLYKVNPDVGMALQDMFKLANTGHYITFPRNSDSETQAMTAHLREKSKQWSRYTAGVDGLVNKFIVQCLVGGAVSIEAVPNRTLSGIATVLFVKPESVVFKRESNGVYHPYQKNPDTQNNTSKPYIRLNPETYLYAGMYNDTDEPYGIPPFMSALDSLNAQHTMRNNMFNIMEKMGLFGFLQALMEKPDMNASESVQAYQNRLTKTLRDMKRNLKDGMADGIVTGFIGDHEFELNSTTANLSNVEKPWQMNEQQVANGLGINGTLIGVSDTKTEGGTGIMLSKMISQLRNIQMIVGFVLEFLYTLELRLAGFNNKGVKVKFFTSTISDEVKVQQAEEYKIRNVNAKYSMGIISQNDAARELGYDEPDESEPRMPTEDVGTPEDSAAKSKREADKDKSDRKVRDKAKANPKRGDQNPTER